MKISTSYAIGTRFGNKGIGLIISHNVFVIANRISSVKGSHCPIETYYIASNDINSSYILLLQSKEVPNS